MSKIKTKDPLVNLTFRVKKSKKSEFEKKADKMDKSPSEIGRSLVDKFLK